MRPRRNIILFSSDAADLSTRRFVYENRLLTIRTWGVGTTHDLCDLIPQVPDPRLAIIVWHDPVEARKAGELLNVGLPDVPVLVVPGQWRSFPLAGQIGFRFEAMGLKGTTPAQTMDFILSLVERKRGPAPRITPRGITFLPEQEIA